MPPPPSPQVAELPAQSVNFQESEPIAEIPAFDISDVIETFVNLAGVALLIAAIVNSLKLLGIVQDGVADSWSAGLNLAAFIGLIVLKILGKADLVPLIDAQAGIYANILTFIVGYVVQIITSRKGHDSVFAGLPLIGTSFSKRKAGESLLVDVNASVGSTEAA